VSRPGNLSIKSSDTACCQARIKFKNKKAHFFSLERFAAGGCNGLENAKAGLVALAEFLERSASEPVNQRD